MNAGLSTIGCESLAPAARAAADVDIGVIYTYERAHADALLPGLSGSAPGYSLRLLLVDNASTTGVERWTEIFERTHVLTNARRLGYAANLNRILAVSDARYTLLLNTDMRFAPSLACVGKMVEWMDAHPQCGVAGCRLLQADGSEGRAGRRFPTVPMIAARRLRALAWTGAAERMLYGEYQPHDSFACDWLSGCFLMVRRQAAAEVGPLDEGFQKYFEDVDYCLRMWQRGWQVHYHGQTCCWHYEQRASRNLLSRDAWTHLRSYGRWLAKNGPAALWRSPWSTAGVTVESDATVAAHRIASDTPVSIESFQEAAARDSAERRAA